MFRVMRNVLACMGCVVTIACLQGCSTKAETEQNVNQALQQKYIDMYNVTLPKAEEGDRYSQYLMATMYHNGQGVEYNINKAAYWYKKSADQGNMISQTRLGIMYYLGRGVKKNTKKALILLNQAKEQGSIEAIQVIEKLTQ
jgi:uncharacterized protein